MESTLVHPQVMVATPDDSPAPIAAPNIHDEATASLWPGVTPYLFNAEQFSRMVEARVFPRELRLELWDGKVYEKMAKLRAHSLAAAKFLDALGRIKPAGWYLNLEESISLDAGKVPLPDVVLIRGQPEDYRDGYATNCDVGLLVELSYSSLRDDTGPKLAAYARAAIPQYWVANLINNVLLVFRDPVPDESRYATAETYRHGETVPFWLNGVEIAQIAVSDLLPRKQT